jgi:hypothetical protein
VGTNKNTTMLSLEIQKQSQNQPDTTLLSSDPRPVDCSLASTLFARFPINGNHGNYPSRKFLQAQRSTTGKQRVRKIESKENPEKFFFLGYLGGWWSLKDAAATSSRHNKKLALRF